MADGTRSHTRTHTHTPMQLGEGADPAFVLPVAVLMTTHSQQDIAEIETGGHLKSLFDL